jgi:predicted flap endonuclease-1-like 5' DNA nuclease
LGGAEAASVAAGAVVSAVVVARVAGAVVSALAVDSKETRIGGANMAKKLTEIEGIGPTYAAKLAEAGVKSQEELLAAGSTPKGRSDLEKTTGISGKLVLKWINRADLARVKGIGEEYADLLELAGVDTVPALAQRNPEHLHKTLTGVAAAKDLPRVITY